MKTYDESVVLQMAFEEIRRQLRDLALANPLQSASVTKGRVRFIGGTLRIEEGGRFELEGTLEGAGTIKWEGTFDQTGPTTLRGPVKITGENGTLTVEAETKLLDNLSVQDGGTIDVGGLTITPAVGGGAIVFDSGAELRSMDGLTWLVHGNNGVAVDGNQVIMRYGTRQLRIATDGVKLTGLPSRAGTGLPPSALGADADGTLWRAT